MSYLIAVGAVSTVSALPLISANPALAQNVLNVDVTVEVGQAAHITLPGSGSYNVYSWPNCGKAYWAGTAYTFDTADASNGRPACGPTANTSNPLLDNVSGDRININLTVIPATPPAVLAPPSAPAAPTVSVSSTTGAMTITWAAADPAEQVDGYEYSLDSGSTWTAGTSPTVIENLPVGLYPVGVRAHNASGYGSPSTFVPGFVFVLTPPTPPTPPAPPTPPVPTPPTPTPTPTPPTPTPTRTHPTSPPKRPTPPTPKAPTPPVPALPSTQQQGSRGSDVARIQRLLGIPADGIFGPQTAAAVRAFQSAHHLQVDGIVGPQTWTALLGAGSGATGGTTSASATRPWLRFGSTGSHVREAQQLLGVRIDGIFGVQTRAAAVAFQTSHRLQIDGIVGTQTWAALLAG